MEEKQNTSSLDREESLRRQTDGDKANEKGGIE